MRFIVVIAVAIVLFFGAANWLWKCPELVSPDLDDTASIAQMVSEHLASCDENTRLHHAFYLMRIADKQEHYGHAGCATTLHRLAIQAALKGSGENLMALESYGAFLSRCHRLADAHRVRHEAQSLRARLMQRFDIASGITIGK